ncbi:ISL3 family transposase [Ideonella livida]|uniref:ISL3 family transposase n=1 Tax=Ideonella livida TaxID=2707176 RepID=A0A7C9TJR5_9BURK|nr:ISL3 family transposase [Ideonella livida]NDY91938.1 ISL3 family transposase [Ideonella livida]
MSVGVEALFTSALGLQLPWVVEDVKLDTAKRRIDFEIGCQGVSLSCPACGAAAQPVHDRLRRSWRHLDFFQFEAWLHCDVPRVACGGCGKTTQMSVPWARPGSGFTAAFEALALTLCRDLPVRQAAALLRCGDKQLWRRIEHYVGQARALERLDGVSVVGIDETSLRRGQHYITVVHDLVAKRLLFATEGRSHQTVLDFVADLRAHGGDPAQVRHVCMDMSAAYALGVTKALPQAQISYDRFHVVAMAMEAMDQVRRQEMADDPTQVRQALGGRTPQALRQLMWGMRRNPATWSRKQIDTMHWLQRSGLKSARAWRLKMALREVYAQARTHNDPEQADQDLKAWLGWARRCRLEPFKKLASTLAERQDAVVRGMVDHRSNAFVEAMNGPLQQAKRAARSFRTSTNFIAIAYLRMAKLKHLPASPFALAQAQ